MCAFPETSCVRRSRIAELHCATYMCDVFPEASARRSVRTPLLSDPPAARVTKAAHMKSSSRTWLVGELCVGVRFFFFWVEP